MGLAFQTDGRPGMALAAPASPAPQVPHHGVGFVHTAVRHRSPRELATRLVPFVDDALAVNDPVYVSLPPAGMGALKTALGRDADRLRWSDSNRWNPHPMRRLRAIRELVEGAERHGVGRLHMIGECPVPSVPAMAVEWERYDALLNDVLAGHPVTIVCTFDESVLPSGVVERARWSHPLVGLDPADPNPSYLEPGEYLTRHRLRPIPVPPDAPSLSGRVGPSDARGLVRAALARAWGALSPVPAGVVEDVALAVTGLVTNSWQAGARSVAVTCWRIEGEAGAQVDDDGPGLTDPLAGYRWPDPSNERGRGLWLARQLMDVLDICATASGTSVRARVFDAA